MAHEIKYAFYITAIIISHNLMCIMRFNKLLSLIIYASSIFASISIRRAGWLDRVVEYHKKRFLEDLKTLPLVNIEASIERAPPGYVDSTNWDYNSVVRLLTLIRSSKAAKPVRFALRRALQSNRRFMSFQMSLKAFPSLAKDNPNYFYYDVDAGEYYADVAEVDHNPMISDDDVIFIKNPVEAKLPSARISVRLLKSIMENRSKARRSMSTTMKTIPWSPMNKTSSQLSSASADASKATVPVTTLQDSSSNTDATVTSPAA